MPEFPGMKKKEPEAPKVNLIPNKEGLTLRKWFTGCNCTNMALQPLMNTQFAMLGAMDALHEENLLQKITGSTGVSSGAFLAAIAATKDYPTASKTFRKVWPGWAAFGKKDPELSKNYREHVLQHVIPQNFEELNIPVALTATK